MTEPKFTPAPWVCEGSTQDGDFCIYQERTDEEVLDIHFGTVTMHNFSLILAAPDLYRALKDIVDSMSSYDDDEFADARKALAKANGESF